MKVIQAELNRVAEEICKNICKYGEKYTKEEWGKCSKITSCLVMNVQYWR